MKRRIIGLILVIVMLALSLTGCGYSIAEDDLSVYATFTAEDKAALATFLEKVMIEDGDFTASPETRAKKVMDNIYGALASKADKDDKKTEGKLGAIDLFYYCYYATAEIKGETKYFFMTNMKTANAASVQLGLVEDDDVVANAIRAAIANFEFTKENVLTTTTSGNVKPGDVAFVTYSYSYPQVDAEGNEKDIEGKRTNEMIVVTENNDEFAGRLNGKSINSTIADFDLVEEGRGTVSYSDVKINWVSNGDALTSFKATPYDETKNSTPTAGASEDLKDVELTYYIYPVHFVSVDEFSALNLINVILGKNITEASLHNILFGADYVGISEDTEDEEEKEKLEELEEFLKDYVYKAEDGKETTLEELAESLADLQEKLEDAKKELDKAEEDLAKKQDAKDEAQKKVDEAGESATEAQKSDLTKAQTALDLSKEDHEKASTAHKDALKARDDEVNKLLSFENMADKLVKGYKKATYDSLQNSYNNEIKMNLAHEIYHYLTENVEIDGVPEKAAEEIYEQIIENYEYSFYNDDYDTTNKISNYKKYSGSFKKFLIEKVKTDIKSVGTYKEALAAIKEEAEELTKPIVRIYVVADAYGVLVDDKAFEEYKKDKDNNYSYYEYYYGESSVRYAHQFDELMNYFLESEEKESEPDENGFVLVENDYKLLDYEIGEPASKQEDEEKEETEE